MATCKLGVEVVSAHDLKRQDGQGISPYVVLRFDCRHFCTTTKENDLNPVWNERFSFDVSDPSNLPNLFLKATIHHKERSKNDWRGTTKIYGTSFVPLPDAVVVPYSLKTLGKSAHKERSKNDWRGTTKIYGTSFVPLPDAVVVPYSLKTLGKSALIKGELRLKVYITGGASIRASDPLPATDSVICSSGFQVSKNLESILQGQSSPHVVPFQCLEEITNNFSDDRVLGQGGSGMVYKGVLRNGEIIAVKKIMSLIPGLQKQFVNEVSHLMELKHANIVRCLGYCYETKNEFLQHNGKYVCAEMAQRLLCLEYMPNGSLNKYISDESSGLDWSTRYKIIEGICYGLYHLHEQIDEPIIHLDLKPANILLDDSLVPKITDFGLSRLFGQHQTICTSSRFGTFGYMAPEFLHGGTITPKLDIFSLGVIIMEIITGHRDYPGVTGTSSDDFTELTLDKWRNVLQSSPGYGSLEMDCEQIKRCIQVGLICVNPDRTKRPPMAKIINMLQGSKNIDYDISNEAA